jgi:hypothetical protein
MLSGMEQLEAQKSWITHARQIEERGYLGACMEPMHETRERNLAAAEYGNPEMQARILQGAHSSPRVPSECPFAASANPDMGWKGENEHFLKKSSIERGNFCASVQEPCMACKLGRMCEGLSEDEAAEVGAHRRIAGEHLSSGSETQRTSHIWRSFSRRVLFAHGQGACITLKQMFRHRTDESFWLAAHGHVYDITGYLSRHPGGKDTILRNARADNSEDFEFHSTFGQETWKRHRIGRLVLPEGEVPRDAAVRACESHTQMMACGMTQETSSCRQLQANQLHMTST